MFARPSRITWTVWQREGGGGGGGGGGGEGRVFILPHSSPSAKAMPVDQTHCCVLAVDELAQGLHRPLLHQVAYLHHTHTSLVSHPHSHTVTHAPVMCTCSCVPPTVKLLTAQAASFCVRKSPCFRARMTTGTKLLSITICEGAGQGLSMHTIMCVSVSADLHLPRVSSNNIRQGPHCFLGEGEREEREGT